MRPDPAWSVGVPDLRASDAERERVARFLRDHAAEGRLTPDELGDRVGAAYAAVTLGDLRALVTDLPGSPFPQHPPARGTRERSGGTQDWTTLLTIAALLAIAVPSVAWAVWLTLFAGAVAMFALFIAVGIALGPFVLVAAAAFLVLRRRRERWVRGPYGLR